MAAHCTDDDLVLHHYGEPDGRHRIERHLESCEDCRRRAGDLASTLELIETPPIPERGDQYGLEVWQRIRHRLPEHEQTWWHGWRWSGHEAAMAAAGLALVVGAFAAGRSWPRPAATPANGSAVRASAGSASARQTDDVGGRILMSAVADHLDRSERVLTGIMNATSRSEIAAEQRRAGDLLSASRLYRQDAEDTGEQSMASVLDEVERALLDIVHSPATIDPAALERMRRQIDTAALLFKVRVLGDELRRQEPVTGRIHSSETVNLGYQLK